MQVRLQVCTLASDQIFQDRIGQRSDLFTLQSLSTGTCIQRASGTASLASCDYTNADQNWADYPSGAFKETVQIGLKVEQATETSFSQAATALSAALIAWNTGNEHTYIYENFPQLERVVKPQVEQQDDQRNCSDLDQPSLPAGSAVFALTQLRRAAPKALTVGLMEFCLDGKHGFRFSANSSGPSLRFKHTALADGPSESVLRQWITLDPFRNAPKGHAESNLLTGLIPSTNATSKGWVLLAVMNQEGFICEFCMKYLLEDWGANRKLVSTYSYAWTTGGEPKERFFSHGGFCTVQLGRKRSLFPGFGVGSETYICNSGKVF